MLMLQLIQLHWSLQHELQGGDPYRQMNIYIYLSTVTEGKKTNKCCTGWWYTYPCEKYEFVNWDDDIPN